MPTCRDCGGNILFTRVNSKWRITELDGTDHWDICSERKSALVRTEGKSFTESHSKGYILHGKKYYTEQWSDSIVGANYVPHNPACTVPPWDYCDCDTTIDELDLAHLR